MDGRILMKVAPPVKLKYLYDELVDIQEHFTNHVASNGNKLDTDEASTQISHLLRDCPTHELEIKSLIAIWFLYKVDKGAWEIGDEPFTYLECSVKMNRIKRGASLQSAVKYKFVVEEE